jgi:hypothetical protein
MLFFISLSPSHGFVLCQTFGFLARIRSLSRLAPRLLYCSHARTRLHITISAFIRQDKSGSGNQGTPAVCWFLCAPGTPPWGPLQFCLGFAEVEVPEVGFRLFGLRMSRPIGTNTNSFPFDSRNVRLWLVVCLVRDRIAEFTLVHEMAAF